MQDYKETQQMNQILESLFTKFGFSKLTEIQKQASPFILQKKDCLVIAPTGSGKNGMFCNSHFFNFEKF